MKTNSLVNLEDAHNHLRNQFNILNMDLQKVTKEKEQLKTNSSLRNAELVQLNIEQSERTSVLREQLHKDKYRMDALEKENKALQTTRCDIIFKKFHFCI